MTKQGTDWLLLLLLLSGCFDAVFGSLASHRPSTLAVLVPLM